MSTGDILAGDPGRNVGVALYQDRTLVESAGFPITSFVGAARLHEYFDRACDAGIGRLVLEGQYPGRGRGFKTQVGIAKSRGAMLHEARLHRMQVHTAEPGDWKRAVCHKLSVPWRASPEDKARAILSYATKLKGSSPVTQDEADAIVLGHWYLNQGLYL